MTQFICIVVYRHMICFYYLVIEKKAINIFVHVLGVVPQPLLLLSLRVKFFWSQSMCGDVNMWPCILQPLSFIYFKICKVMFILFERQRDKEAKINLPFTGSLPKYLQQSGPGQVKVRSLEFHPGLPHVVGLSSVAFPFASAQNQTQNRAAITHRNECSYGMLALQVMA